MATKKHEPIIPTTIKVDTMEWTNDIWQGEKFVRVRLTANDGEHEIVMWPSEANCLMQMLADSLNGLDLSYDMMKAYDDVVEKAPQLIEKE